MNPERKINVLVIPDLFPKFQGDVQGIFILDYLTSTKKNCNNIVLFGKLTSDNKGLIVEKKEDYELYKFALTSKKIPFYLKPFFYLLWFMKGYQIGKALKSIDIIHAHGSILSGTLSYLLSKKLKVPFIITEHQGPFTMTSNDFWKRNWTRVIMQKADLVLTVSQHLKQEIIDTHIYPKKIIVTHNPVDTDLFKLKDSLSYKTMLFVGRLDSFKGALRCVKAFEKIHEKHSDWKFTIVGDGEDYQPIVNYLASRKELESKIKLKGQLSKVQIATEMQHADFLVFPSKHESFGLVITEALSSGLPVIVGNTTAPKEFVDAKNGLLVPFDDITAIAKSIENMITSLNTYHSQEIRNKIVLNFGLENFGKKLVNIYKSLIN